MSWAEHVHMATHQLSVVLVGGEHVCFKVLSVGLSRQGADDIVCLKAIDLKHRYAHGSKYLLDDGHRLADVFRSFFSLRLVFAVSLAPECGTVRVEGHAEVLWLLLVEHFVKCVAKSHDGRSVLPFGIDSRVLDQCVIRAVYQCISV